MFRITDIAINADTGAVALPHLTATTPDGVTIDLGEVTSLQLVERQIHELEAMLWRAVRNFAEQQMPALTAAICARLAVEPGYADVVAEAANGRVTFRYQGLCGEIYYQRYTGQMIFTLAGIRYAAVSLPEQRYAGAAIAEAVLTTLAAMPTYPEPDEEELTPTRREQQAASAIIRHCRGGGEVTDATVAVILATATYQGKPIRPTALVIELTRRWLVTLDNQKSQSTLNRTGPTGQLFQRWFVAYGQYTQSTPAELPELASVFLSTAEANHGPAA